MSEENLHRSEPSKASNPKGGLLDRLTKYLAVTGAGFGLIALILVLMFLFGLLSPNSSGASAPCPTYSDSASGNNGVVNLDKISAYGLWLSAGHDGTLQDFFDALVGQPGADGYIGSDGINGAAGATGKTGADGLSAYQLWLDAGNSGSEDDFLRSLLGATGETGATGQTGAPGVDGLSGLSAYELWLRVGNSGDLQTFLNSLVGPRGATGAAGKPGATGATGPTGAPGPAGTSDPSGGTGATGPAGEPGATGPAGPTGPAGEPGATGAAGLSAYQIWEAQAPNNGKTETEFLASLVGTAGICTPGDVGPQGPQGEPGTGGLPYNASFLDTTTQNNSGGVQLMRYNTADTWNEGITVPGGNPSRITFAHAGIYNIQFSTQFAKTDSGTDFIDVWLRKNGSDVPMSNTELRSWGNDDRLVAAWNFFVEVNQAGDYYEIAWQSLDTDVSMLSTTGNGKPGIPSVILTVTQVK